MIWNVVDQRKRPYRWKQVNAVVEAIEDDNGCLDADHAEPASESQVVHHAARERVSVREAVEWANQQTCAVTLYLYDSDVEV